MADDDNIKVGPVRDADTGEIKTPASETGEGDGSNELGAENFDGDDIAAYDPGNDSSGDVDDFDSGGSGGGDLTDPQGFDDGDKSGQAGSSNQKTSKTEVKEAKEEASKKADDLASALNQGKVSPESAEKFFEQGKSNPALQKAIERKQRKDVQELRNAVENRRSTGGNKKTTVKNADPLKDKSAREKKNTGVSLFSNNERYTSQIRNEFAERNPNVSDPKNESEELIFSDARFLSFKQQLEKDRLRNLVAKNPRVDEVSNVLENKERIRKKFRPTDEQILKGESVTRGEIEKFRDFVESTNLDDNPEQKAELVESASAAGTVQNFQKAAKNNPVTKSIGTGGAVIERAATGKKIFGPEGRKKTLKRSKELSGALGTGTGSIAALPSVLGSGAASQSQEFAKEGAVEFLSEQPAESGQALVTETKETVEQARKDPTSFVFQTAPQIVAGGAASRAAGLETGISGSLTKPDLEIGEKSLRQSVGTLKDNLKKSNVETDSAFQVGSDFTEDTPSTSGRDVASTTDFTGKDVQDVAGRLVGDESELAKEKALKPERSGEEAVKIESGDTDNIGSLGSKDRFFGESFKPGKASAKDIIKGGENLPRSVPVGSEGRVLNPDKIKGVDPISQQLFGGTEEAVPRLSRTEALKQRVFSFVENSDRQTAQFGVQDIVNDQNSLDKFRFETSDTALGLGPGSLVPPEEKKVDADPDSTTVSTKDLDISDKIDRITSRDKLRDFDSQRRIDSGRDRFDLRKTPDKDSDTSIDISSASGTILGQDADTGIKNAQTPRNRQGDALKDDVTDKVKPKEDNPVLQTSDQPGGRTPDQEEVFFKNKNDKQVFRENDRDNTATGSTLFGEDKDDDKGKKPGEGLFTEKDKEYKASVGAEILGIKAQKKPGRLQAQNPTSLRPIIDEESNI